MVEERSQLPIADSHNEILSAIEKNQVVLIRGETGSGKTTQVSAVTEWTNERNVCIIIHCSHYWIKNMKILG